ncbi:hypothetical protein TNCV_3828371 [Trichonephila clavipes]|nr:hypothetical protein TNCV_3828371 [Trichonephila clavipes]
MPAMVGYLNHSKKCRTFVTNQTSTDIFFHYKTVNLQNVRLAGYEGLLKISSTHKIVTTPLLSVNTQRKKSKKEYKVPAVRLGQPQSQMNRFDFLSKDFESILGSVVGLSLAFCTQGCGFDPGPSRWLFVMQKIDSYHVV